MFQLTELRCTSFCLVCLATSILAVLLLPARRLATHHCLAVETQRTSSCSRWQRSHRLRRSTKLDRWIYQEVIMVAQLWLRPRLHRGNNGMRIPRPRSHMRLYLRHQRQDLRLGAPGTRRGRRLRKEPASPSQRHSRKAIHRGKVARRMLRQRPSSPPRAPPRGGSQPQFVSWSWA